MKSICQGQYISAVYLLKYPALLYIMKNICQGQDISEVYTAEINPDPCTCVEEYIRGSIYFSYVSPEICCPCTCVEEYIRGSDICQTEYLLKYADPRIHVLKTYTRGSGYIRRYTAVIIDPREYSSTHVQGQHISADM